MLELVVGTINTMGYMGVVQYKYWSNIRALPLQHVSQLCELGRADDGRTGLCINFAVTGQLFRRQCDGTNTSTIKVDTTVRYS